MFSNDFLKIYGGEDLTCILEEKSKEQDTKEVQKGSNQGYEMTGIIKRQTCNSNSKTIKITFKSDHVNSKIGFEIFVEFLAKGDFAKLLY